MVAAAINRYCYLTCRYLPPFFTHKYRIAYSQMETVNEIAEIKHPSVRACLQYLQVKDGVEIHHDSDLPKQTGLGTSSSFAVGLLNVLHRLRRDHEVSGMELAQEAIHVERELCRENVGSQDQVTTAIGGLNRIDFLANGEIQAVPLCLSAERVAAFEGHLMLFFTGFSRYASEVVVEQLNNLGRKEKELHAMRAMVDQAVAVLQDPRADLKGIGTLLHESWSLKRELSSKISSAAIDEIYAAARAAGALGGKLCGAGGGGFMLLFVEPEKQAQMAQALRALLRVPFALDFKGTQIIFEDKEST